MKKRSRRIEIVERLLKLEYFYGEDEIEFSNSTVIDEIKESMKIADEANDRLIHNLKVKKFLKDNNINMKGDDEE